MTFPSVSNPALPARPAICWTLAGDRKKRCKLKQRGTCGKFSTSQRQMRVLRSVLPGDRHTGAADGRTD
eukprot:3936429-Rhodomonas_salina.3